MAHSDWERPYDHTVITIVFGYVEEKLLPTRAKPILMKYSFSPKTAKNS